MSAVSSRVRAAAERRIDEDSSLDDEAGLLVLAALDGDDAFAAELAATGPDAHRAAPGAGDASSGAGGDGPLDAPTTVERSTAGSYLASITVEGFRGVGERATLSVNPGPGLTVVAGRNGSGKSSFAEAAELAITGANRRWEGRRSAVWRDGWRNLHTPDPARISVEIVGDGEPSTVVRSWGAEEGLDGGTWTRQVRGRPVEPIERPADAVVTYRPFLSYNELGSVIDGPPSEMYDALFTLLGLEDVTAAHRRVADARKALDTRAKAARDERTALLGRLETHDDERAARATALLTARTVDLDALSELALAGEDDTVTVARLRAVTALSLPAVGTVDTALQAVADARESLDAASSAQAVVSADLARLLRVALDHHERHGDGPCPVCGQGTLNSSWREDADRRAVEAERGAGTLGAARRRAETARGELASLVVAPPPVLSPELPIPVDALRDAWTRWHEALDAPDVAAGLTRAGEALRPALTDTIAAAETELARRDETWRPIATALVALHARLETAQREAASLAVLKRAESWIKDTGAAIRDDRLAPFARQSQDIWGELRQQSNVDLGPIRLDGSATRRRAVFDVSVDDVDGAALGVMSQGELHSLALSLFLPRATVDESPFRFVMIDDPVQAMDPAKVDGLAHVLSEVARHRQVVVFSHDDRLAESVRRTKVPATILEVVREDRSRVVVRPCDDPVVRHLDDANAMVRSDHVPEDLRREIVASSCRSALEAASHAAYRRVRLRDGDARDLVEQRLAEAHTLHQVLTLAVLHDLSRQDQLYSRLGGASRSAVDVVKACKQGAHRGYSGDLGFLVTESGKLCDWIGRR